MHDHNQHVEDAVHAAVASGKDLYQQVRDITLKALTERELDMGNIKNVVQAVGKGISYQNEPSKTTFKQSVDVLDDALGQTAEASVGRQTQSAMQSLNQLRQIGQETIISNTVATSSSLARIASGFLSGIAESLHPQKPNS